MKMLIKKEQINDIFYVFLISHLIIWTLIPTLSNSNLPLDTIEALAWGTNLEWGYSKHPPGSAFFAEVFYQMFGSQDWAFYLLCQLFVVFAFFVVWKLSQEFFENKFYSIISILLLEGIYFYNFTTPEFNVNVCQLPFWALSVLYGWRGFKDNKTIDWLLFGLFAALGILSKYLFIYLLVAMDVFFYYMIIKKKIKLKSLISLIPFFLILLPHIIWLTENNYITITYGLHRTGSGDQNFLDHIINPLIFLGKQIGILIPFFVMFFFIVSKVKAKINIKDKKLFFLICVNIVPIFLMFLTSMIMGAKIRTMWMTPFYLSMGVFIVYIFQSKINLKKLKGFVYTFLILFILSPLVYGYISINEIDKKINYPGKEISELVQKKWDENFTNRIGLVGGDEWHGGNLSYHLKSRPRWDNIFEGKGDIVLNNDEDGFILIGDFNILENICKGVFVKIENQGICMIGKKK